MNVHTDWGKSRPNNLMSGQAFRCLILGIVNGSIWVCFKCSQMLKGINYESNSEKGMSEGVKKEPSYTVVKNLNRCTHYGEQYGGALKKL